MKTITTSFLAALLFSIQCNADTFIIGGKEVDIPIPDGFVRVTDDMTEIKKFVDQMVDPMNDMLAYYIMESEADAARNGEFPSLERTFNLKINRELRNYTVSRADFLDLKNAIKKQNSDIFENIESQLSDPINEMSEGVSEEFDVDFAMQVSKMVPLDVHSETTDSMAYSMYINYGVKVEDEELSEVVAATATFINASGSLLFLYSYAPKEQLEWTRTSAQNWANSIISNNEAPPEEIKRERSFGWDKVLVAAIIGGLIGLFRTVFKKKKES